MKIPHSITLVIVYFGKWPVWFPAFLLSCERNPDVTWLVFTDCPPPPQHPPNVRFVQTTMDSIRKLASERLGFEAALQDPRKLCDLKVTYGILFQEHLGGSVFWGFCDIDVIWGNLRKYFPEPLLDAHDILTTRKGLIAGHLCLLRNTPELIALCTEHPDFKRMMQLPGYQWFDEVAFSDLVEKKAIRHGLRVYWPGCLVNFSKHVDSLPSYLSWLDLYTWKDGALHCFAEGGKEIPYLHFMNWKNTLRWCGFDYGSKVTFFNVGYSGITTEQSGPPLGYRIKARLESFRKPSLYLLYFLRTVKRALRRQWSAHFNFFRRRLILSLPKDSPFHVKPLESHAADIWDRHGERLELPPTEFMDLSAHFLNDRGGIRKELSTDTLHLSKEGYETFARGLLPHL